MTLKLNGTNSVAAPAYAGDDADTGLQCGTNELKLVTGGTARATVDSSGNVAIGTTTATTRLDVEGNNIPLEVNSANSNGNKVQLSDAGTVRGYFGATSTASFLVSSSGGSEQLRVQSAGGISFNGDTAAVNALDDYEEGTWTPRYITRDGSTGTVYELSGPSYTTQVAAYTKIGKQIFVQGRVTLSSKGTVTNGQIGISGLPYPVQNVVEGWSAMTLGFSANWTNVAPQAGLALPNASLILLYTNNGASAQTSVGGAVTQAHLSDQADTIFGCTYVTD